MGRLLFVRNTGRVMVLKWLVCEAGIGILLSSGLLTSGEDGVTGWIG